MTESAGAAHSFLTSDDLPARIAAVTNGAKAHVVYDSVGKDTFKASLNSLRPFGTMVVFGAAPAVEPQLLDHKGCLFLTRPSIFPHNATRDLLSGNAAELLAAIRSGWVRAEIGARFPLASVGSAHAAIEARQTTGSVLLEVA